MGWRVSTTQTFSLGWSTASPLNLSVTSLSRHGGHAHGTDHDRHVHDSRPEQLRRRVQQQPSLGAMARPAKRVSPACNEQFTLTAGHVYEQTGSLPVSVTLTNTPTEARAQSGQHHVERDTSVVDGQRGLRAGRQAVGARQALWLWAPSPTAILAITASDFSVQITPRRRQPSGRWAW